MKTLEQYLVQLESNDYALKTLDRRLDDINKGHWHYGFYEVPKRVELYNKAVEVKKRVLRMRYRILENMKRSIDFKMNDTSLMQREVKTLKVA